MKENLNKVAVKRGPIVYCLESPDLTDGFQVAHIIIPAGIKFKPTHEEYLLGGITVLEGRVLAKRSQKQTRPVNDGLQQSMSNTKIRLIPYFAWANRGVSYMTVWMPVE